MSPWPLLQVYYTTKPQKSLSQWESQFVDNNKLTTISDLTPHTIYTIRVEAYTSIGPGPLSSPVQVRDDDDTNQDTTTVTTEYKTLHIIFQAKRKDILSFASIVFVVGHFLDAKHLYK